MKAVIFLISLTFLFTLPLTGAQHEEAVGFTQGELEQMLAPIALYPDSLLAQILTASTYPLEIVELARWSRDNPELEGVEAVDAVDDREWDASVKALAAFPQILERMDEDLVWTRQLGDAFLLQEEEVMSSIQNLREKAYEAGSLDSLEHVTVNRERDVIVIESKDPQIVYVPYYRPTIVYGTWGWPAYPPAYWGPPASYSTVYYRSGRTRVVWTSGVVVRSGFFFSTVDWPRRQVVVVNHHHHHYQRSARPRRSDADWSRYATGERWRHEPRHRRGVTYRGDALNERYGRSAASTRTERSSEDSRRNRHIRYAPHPGREGGYASRSRSRQQEVQQRSAPTRENPVADANQGRTDIVTRSPRGRPGQGGISQTTRFYSDRSEAENREPRERRVARGGGERQVSAAAQQAAAERARERIRRAHREAQRRSDDTAAQRESRRSGSRADRSSSGRERGQNRAAASRERREATRGARADRAASSGQERAESRGRGRRAQERGEERATRREERRPRSNRPSSEDRGNRRGGERRGR